MPPGASFNVHLCAPGNTFRHRAEPTNIQGHVTVIDNPQTNGNPQVILIVTPRWDSSGVHFDIAGGQAAAAHAIAAHATEAAAIPTGVYDNHPIGVYYNGSRWAIFNQDIQAMPNGAAFNVEVYAPSDAAFVHRAVAANIAGHTTVIKQPDIA